MSIPLTLEHYTMIPGYFVPATPPHDAHATFMMVPKGPQGHPVMLRATWSAAPGSSTRPMHIMTIEYVNTSIYQDTTNTPMVHRPRIDNHIFFWSSPTYAPVPHTDTDAWGQIDAQWSSIDAQHDAHLIERIQAAIAIALQQAYPTDIQGIDGVYMRDGYLYFDYEEAYHRSSNDRLRITIDPVIMPHRHMAHPHYSMMQVSMAHALLYSEDGDVIINATDIPYQIRPIQDTCIHIPLTPSASGHDTMERIRQVRDILPYITISQP